MYEALDLLEELGVVEGVNLKKFAKEAFKRAKDFGDGSDYDGIYAFGVALESGKLSVLEDVLRGSDSFLIEVVIDILPVSVIKELENALGWDLNWEAIFRNKKYDMTEAHDVLKYILEFKLNREEALELLDISSDAANDSSKLKMAFRKASMKHHPDKGGSTEMMQKVVAAHELLKAGTSGVSSTSSGFDREAYRRREQEYKDLGLRVISILKNSIDLDEFIEYFKELGGKTFSSAIIFESPKSDTTLGYGWSHANLTYEFFTYDRSTVFELGLSADLITIKHDRGSLGSGDVSFKLLVEAFGYHNKKKQKLSQRDWKHTSNHVVLKNPMKAFPMAKIKKIFSGATSKRAFKRRDMLLALEKELGATFNDDWVRIPIGDGKEDYRLVIIRQVFMRKPFWIVNGIYLRSGRFSNERVARPSLSSMPETETTIDFLLKLQKDVGRLSGDKLVNNVEKALNSFKKTESTESVELMFALL